MNELKPCPFCGSNHIFLEEESIESFGHNRLYRIRCTYCGGSSGWRATKSEAERAWNNSEGRTLIDPGDKQTDGKTVEEIVTDYLKSNGYDGLFNMRCYGCSIDNLFACVRTLSGCMAAYEFKCKECDNYDGCAFTISDYEYSPAKEWCPNYKPIKRTDSDERD